MIDLHTHTFLSDGDLGPAELVQRASRKGYSVLGITDHADSSNLDQLISQLLRFSLEINQVRSSQIKVIPGIELTHLPPCLIGPLAKRARKKGAKIVIVHGETIVEPVPVGTNRAALEADIDILAHPGLIGEEEVKIAAEKGIYLEISSRKGHCLTNGRVAGLAKKYGANMILNTDAHSSVDLITQDQGMKVLLGAGLSSEESEAVLRNSALLAEEKLSRFNPTRA